MAGHPVLAYMDTSRFIIEDYTGALVYVHGDLSRLLGPNPVMDRILVEQLNVDAHAEYREHQHQLTMGKKPTPIPLDLGSGWSCLIVPLGSYDETKAEGCNTVSVFSQAA